MKSGITPWGGPTTVRRAVARDAKRLTRLVRGSRAYEGQYAAMVADYRVGPDYIETHRVFVAVAADEYESRVLGFYSLVLAPPELDLLFVADGAQGRGIGRLLVAHMKSEARTAGLDRVRVVSHPPPRASTAAWARCTPGPRPRTHPLWRGTGPSWNSLFRGCRPVRGRASPAEGGAAPLMGDGERRTALRHTTGQSRHSSLQRTPAERMPRVAEKQAQVMAAPGVPHGLDELQKNLLGAVLHVRPELRELMGAVRGMKRGKHRQPATLGGYAAGQLHGRDASGQYVGGAGPQQGDRVGAVGYQDDDRGQPAEYVNTLRQVRDLAQVRHIEKCQGRGRRSRER